MSLSGRPELAHGLLAGVPWPLFVSLWSLWSLCPVEKLSSEMCRCAVIDPAMAENKHWRGVESDIPGVIRVSKVLYYRGIANGSGDRACFRNELISRASNWLARGGDGMTQSVQRVFESSRLEEIKVELPFMPRSRYPTFQSFLSTKARTHRCSTLR